MSIPASWQYLQNAATGRHREFKIGTGEPNRITAGQALLVLRREVFDMHLCWRQVRRRGFECRKHRGGATAVKMRCLRRRPDGSGEVKELPPVFLVTMQTHAWHAGKFVGERHVRARSAGVMQLE